MRAVKKRRTAASSKAPHKRARPLVGSASKAASKTASKATGKATKAAGKATIRASKTAVARMSKQPATGGARLAVKGKVKAPPQAPRKATLKMDRAAGKVTNIVPKKRAGKRSRSGLVKTALGAIPVAIAGMRKAVPAITGAAVTVPSRASGGDASKSHGVQVAAASGPFGASAGHGTAKQTSRAFPKPAVESVRGDGNLEPLVAAEAPARAQAEPVPMEAAANAEARPPLPVPIASFTI